MTMPREFLVARKTQTIVSHTLFDSTVQHTHHCGLYTRGGPPWSYGRYYPACFQTIPALKPSECLNAPDAGI